MDTLKDILILMAKVELMRDYQRNYFARRQDYDKKMAIKMEKEVDTFLLLLRRREYNPDSFKEVAKTDTLF